MAKKTTFKSAAAMDKALRKLPRLVIAEVRKENRRRAERIAASAQQNARSAGHAASLVGPTVEVTGDDDPRVTMGGSRAIPGHTSGTRSSVGDLVFGAEYGGRGRSTTMQFEPWMGNRIDSGYFLGPAIRTDDATADERLGDALGDALDEVR